MSGLKLPVLVARVIIQKLGRAGFRFIYAKGSHYFMQHPITKKITSIPMHGSKNIGKGLINKILKQAGISLKQFLDL